MLVILEGAKPELLESLLDAFYFPEEIEYLLVLFDYWLTENGVQWRLLH